jgi:hypothetical protein
MQHVVQPGDSLWLIAGVRFGDPGKWPVIAQDNNLRRPSRLLVGQTLHLRDSLLTKRADERLSPPMSQPSFPPPVFVDFERAPSVVPARGFFFVLADEVNPLRQKVVRKVMINPTMAAAVTKRLGRPVPTMPNPEQFGLHPTGPGSSVSIGRHALGMKPSAYSSASSGALGAPRMAGSRFWVDVEKAERAGATFHDTEEILADLDRIARKTTKATDLSRIEKIKGLVRADAEVLVRGAVPASAIKGATAMALTRGLQGVQVVGLVMTAVDVSHAIDKSAAQQSIKPIAAETIRQAGGWAVAWAGAKLGAAGGAALGIETGPGAILTGAIGGLVGGFAGYWGFDWIADHIDAN